MFLFSELDSVDSGSKNRDVFVEGFHEKATSIDNAFFRSANRSLE